MFACLSFFPGDVVTHYAGKINEAEPMNTEYCIEIATNNLGKMYIDSIRVHQCKLGLASFVKKETRARTA